MSNKYLDQVGLKTLVTAVALKISQKSSGTVLSVKSGNVNNISVDATDPANPIININADLMVKINTMWDIAVNGVGKEVTPNPVLDYAGEKLANLTPNALYTVNAVPVYSNANGEIPLYQSWLGTTINIIKKATVISKQDSDSKAVVIAARPATPVILYTYSTGKISGVTTLMEYKQTLSAIWYNCTGTTITNLSNVSYDVRVKATATTFASAIVSTVVTSSFVPVTDISGVIKRIEMSQWNRVMDYTLGGLVVPNNASNTNISWSIMDSGGTGPSIVSNGTKLECWGTGIVGLQARISNGLASGTSYVEYFSIEVVAPGTL